MKSGLFSLEIEHTGGPPHHCAVSNDFLKTMKFKHAGSQVEMTRILDRIRHVPVLPK